MGTRQRQFITALLLPLAWALGTSCGAAGLPVGRVRPPEPTERLIIQWRTRGVTAVQIDSIEGRAARLQATSGTLLRPVRNLHDRLDVLRLDRALRPAAMQALITRLRLDPSIEYVEPDARRYIAAFPADPPDDPRFVAGSDANGSWRGQWYLKDGLAQDAATSTPAAIGATTAWRTTRGSSAYVVAVLDTGVDYTHPDLGTLASGGPLLPGRDFVSCDDGADLCSDPANALVANDGNGWDADATDPGDWVAADDLTEPAFQGCDDALGDSSWHGTRVAALIAARTNNAAGMAGIAPGVLILPVRVLGKCTGYTSDVVAAMRWAAGLPVTNVPDNPYPAAVLNLSLGANQPCSTTEQDAITEIRARGVVIVASAGNSGGPVNAPANCPGVIAVAGLRHLGTKVGYSNVSSTAASVTIAAPAGNCVNIAAGSECLYSIETASDDGSTAPRNPIYTYSVFAPGYAGNSTNVANVGTSFATPIVAAVAALMASANGNLTPSLLATRLQQSATPFPTPALDDAGAAIPGCTVRSAVVDSDGNFTDVPATPQACGCSTATCGAGMLNAAAAVDAALRPIAVIEASDDSASVGQTIRLDGRDSGAATGHAIVGWSWTSSPSVDIANRTQPEANFLFPALRPVTVTLTVTDDAGRTDSTSATIVSSTGIGSGEGGGGVLGLELGLLAALLLARRRWPNLN
ncbi:MAG: S8 family serine peptidase [Gammaproteobacteria bacterium]|nr:S8 family serine peptidase [Gammaproteobacteria bacterium]